MKNFLTALVSGAMALSVLAGAQAGAVTVSFDRITSNSPADAAGQLSAEITDGGTGVYVDFTVANGANPGANVAEIYFSDTLGLFTPPPSIFSQSAGVSFEVGGVNTPGELPSANNASPPFVTTAGLVAELDGNNATGLSVGETLILFLTYAGGADFADVLAALAGDQFRIGLHVRSLLDDESDSFVSDFDAPEVPLPAAAWLMMAGIAGLGFAGRRKAA